MTLTKEEALAERGFMIKIGTLVFKYMWRHKKLKLNFHLRKEK